ncbi:MAG: helix-turn-helix domain-containing protein [Myxococcales bacterium]|nr:helix-turn-helix domain-containing protein [Myxococcales bacterium]
MTAVFPGTESPVRRIHSASRASSTYRLLAHEEEELLAYASVFRGGFDAESLAEVIGEVEPARIKTIAERLLAGSILARAEDGRLLMPAATMDLASATLAKSGRETDAITRHAERFAELARELCRADAGPEAAPARRVLAREAENFAVVQRRGAARPTDIDPSLVLESALAIAAGARGGAPLSRALSSLDAALQRCGGAIDTALQTRALLARGCLLEQMGRPAEALGSLRLAAEWAAGLRDPELRARAIEARGRALLSLESWREAREALEAAAGAFADLEMPGHEARATLAIGDTWFFVDDLVRAEVFYREALRIAEDAGDPAVFGLATSRLAIVEMELGRAEPARLRLHQAIALHRALGDRVAETTSATYLAVLELDAGLFAPARARLDAAIATARDLECRKTFALASLYRGALSVELGHLDEAELALDAADRVSSQLGAGSTQAYARGWQGALAARRGDLEGAAHAFELARGYFRARKEQSFYASTVELLAGHLDLARAEAAQGDPLAAGAHRAAARRRLTRAASGDLAQTDMRIARRLLESALGAAVPSESSEARPGLSTSDALIIEPTGSWFRAPGEAVVDLSRRAPLRHILSLLLDARLSAPGSPVSTLEIMHTVWTDTRDLPVLQNRLRVAIATLRKLGLAPSLLTRGGGYILDPRIEVLAAE